MTRTYSALLRGDRLEWTGEVPSDLATTDGAVPVTVVISDPARRPADGGDDPERWRRACEALDRLAASNPFKDITDPVAWQREIRKDRPLPGRDDE